MQIKPTKRNLLVKFIQPKGQLILTAAAETLAPTFDDAQRTRVKVIEVSNEIERENELKIGDFLLLKPKPLLLPVNAKDGLVLITADAVEAVVLDDKDEE